MTAPHRLENFHQNHHPFTQESYRGQTRWWREETTTNRCPVCWLRRHQCHCSALEQHRQRLTQLQSELGEPCTLDRRFQVVLYYHYLELGRSANTAHVLQALYPELCSSLVFGDVEGEQTLLNEIRAEHLENRPSTIILYPSAEAEPLSEWLARRPATCVDQPVRIVALDGTYPQAMRQYKHLDKSLACMNIPAPMVKLDLGPEGCRSAITGVMYQPQKEKICTFQAVMMAMHQIGIAEPLFQSMLHELDDWMSYILASKIKLGKLPPDESGRGCGGDGVVPPKPLKIKAPKAPKAPNAPKAPKAPKPSETNVPKPAEATQPVQAAQAVHQPAPSHDAPQVVLRKTNRFQTFDLSTANATNATNATNTTNTTNSASK